MDSKKIAAFALGPIAGALFSLITLPIITWIFPPEDVGRISLLYISINFVLMIFSLGTDQAYIRFYHDVSDKAKLFKSALIPSITALGIVLFVTGVFLTSAINDLFDFKHRWLVVLFFIAIIASFITRYLSLILRMQERGVAYSICQLLPKAIFLVIVLLVALKVDNPSFVYLLAAHSLSLLLVSFMFLWQTKAELQVVLNASIDKIECDNVVRFGLPLIFGGMAFWGLTTVDKLFLKSISGLEELAVYSVSTSFAAAAMIIQTVFSTVWAPTVYKWASKGDASERVELATQYVCAIVLLALIFAGLFAPCVALFLPQNYHAVPYIMICCMLYPLLYTLSETTVVGIAISNKTHYSMIASLLAFLVNLIGNILLIPNYGAAGAAISTAISFFTFFILRTEFSRLVWQKVPRVKHYVAIALMIIICTSYSLVGAKYFIEFYVIWLASFVFVLIFYRQQVQGILLFLKAKIIKQNNSATEL